MTAPKTYFDGSTSRCEVCKNKTIYCHCHTLPCKKQLKNVGPNTQTDKQRKDNTTIPERNKCKVCEYQLSIERKCINVECLVTGIHQPLKHLEGVGPDTPTVKGGHGGSQSAIPYRMDLLPYLALLCIAKILDEGERKYGKDNWRSIPVVEHLNHSLTHIAAFLTGDTQDDHLGHAACRLLFACELYLKENQDASR